MFLAFENLQLRSGKRRTPFEEEIPDYTIYSSRKAHVHTSPSIPALSLLVYRRGAFRWPRQSLPPPDGISGESKRGGAVRAPKLKLATVLRDDSKNHRTPRRACSVDGFELSNTCRIVYRGYEHVTVKLKSRKVGGVNRSQLVEAVDWVRGHLYFRLVELFPQPLQREFFRIGNSTLQGIWEQFNQIKAKVDANLVDTLHNVGSDELQPP